MSRINFSAIEEEQLTAVVRRYANVLENKQTDAVTSRLFMKNL